MHHVVFCAFFLFIIGDVGTVGLFSKKFLEFWKEGEGEHNRGFFHQNFIKNVFHNKKWEIGPDSIFETRDVGGSQILYVDLLYPEPDFQSH